MPEEPYSEMRPEDVYSLFRVERTSGSLSKVRKDLYPAMIDLQDRAVKACEKADVESLEYDSAVDRKKKLIENIKHVVELRMSKIASMALRGAMGTLNFVDDLPPEERRFYEEVIESAKTLWNAPMRKKKNYRVPEIAIEETIEPPKTVEKTVSVPVPEPVSTAFVPEEDMGDIYIPEEEFADAAAVPATSMEIPPIPEEEMIDSEPKDEPAVSVETVQEPEPVPENNPDAESSELVTVRITEAIPPFAGTVRDYALKKGDLVTIPKSLGSILIRRNLAMKLNI